MKKILDTALELFSEQGYFRTTVSQIARKAQISKGLMYNYFASKEDVLKTIIYKGLEKLLYQFDPNRDGILSDSEFADLIRFYFRDLKENTNYYRLLFSLLTQPGVSQLLLKDFESFSAPYLRLLNEYFNRKGFSNPEGETLFLHALIDGISLNYVSQPEMFPLEYFQEKILEMYQ